VLVLIALLDAVAVWQDADRYDLLDRISNGGSYTLAEADASDNREAVIGVLQLGALVLGAVFFIRWFLRAYYNLDPLRAERRYTHNWAAFGWFVPILNLWRPKQIANDIWRGSDPKPPTERPSNSASIPAILTLWWLFWLASNWASQVAARLAFSDDTAKSLQDSTLAYLVGDVLDIVAAGLAIVVIRQITAREEARAARGALSA
jgi:hypothetical protein